MSNLFGVPLATLRTPLLVGLVALLVSGCASLSGNAMYTYEKVGTDCSLKVDTGRVLAAGISVQLIDCDVTVDAGKVEQGSGNTIKDVVELVKEVKGE